MDRYRLFCGFLEGISTLDMTLAYLYMGGSGTTFLFGIYLVHFFASFAFHILHNRLTRFLDMAMIQLLIMERGYLKTRNVWFYVFCLSGMWFVPDPYDLMVLLINAAVASTQGDITYAYLYLWGFTLVFYLYSCIFQLLDHPVLPTLLCVLYHTYLGVLSAMEVPMYKEGITNTTDGLVRYCAYFLWFSYVMTRLTKDPRRLRSILSLLTAVVLTPLSFYQIYRQVQCGGRYKSFQGDQATQYFTSHFYLAYVVADIVVGMAYYPEYFTLLEGWLHHIGTFSFVVYTYYHNPVKRIFVGIFMMVETPSILLFFSRVLYDVPWAQRIKKKFFYPVFFVFRIVLPTLLVAYLYHLFDFSSYLIYTSFIAINLYWLIKMWC